MFSLVLRLPSGDRIFRQPTGNIVMGSVRENEANLVNEARSGSETAFLTLYNRYRNPLFRFAWRMTGSSALADDVTQECFLALAHGASFDSARGQLLAYLFGIARHLVFKQLRASDREGEELAEPSSALDVLGGLLAAERSEAVRESIALLPTLQREAIILFEYEGLSLEDVAAIAGAEVGAIKARLHRARESLRRRLAPLLFPDKERSCS